MRVATLCLVGLVLLFSGQNPVRQVAITIDDLPRGGDGGPTTLPEVRALTAQLLAPFRERRVPVTGFVNAGRQVAFGPDGSREILELWLDHGADLGNHSRSHLNINRVPFEEYTRDIVAGEPLLRDVLSARGRALRYYRHPFLLTGPTPEVKQALSEFLDRQGYVAAPVTIDNADYQYAALYNDARYRERVRREYVPYMESVTAFFEARAVDVVGREFPQILLLHANQLNADQMPALLDMFEERGYTFVSLEQALADEAYRLPDSYVGRGGFSWIHRWARTKGLPPQGEPEPPAWVQEAWAAR